MTARYLVTSVQTCPRCGGTSRRPHPERPGGTWPCGGCIGTGEIRTEIHLTEVLRALGVRFVDTTHRDPNT